MQKSYFREKVLGVKSNLFLNIELKFEKWEQTDNEDCKKKNRDFTRKKWYD